MKYSWREMSAAKSCHQSKSLRTIPVPTKQRAWEVFFAFSAEEETKINECGILPLFSPNLTAVTSSEWQQKKRSQWLAFNFGFYAGLVVRAIAAQRRGRGFDATKYFSLITCFSSMLCFSLLRIKIIFFEGMMNSLKSIAIKEKYNAMTLETLLYL